MSVLARAVGDIFVRIGARSRTADDAAIARIAATIGGEVGVAALHLETGRTLSSNGGARLPLASTVKIPIAVQLLARVDCGELALDTMVAVEPRHPRPGAGILARQFQIPGVALSVRNLLALALTISDNTAADMILELAGGISAVQERLKALGLQDISVDRTILQLLADVEGITDLPAGCPITPECWRSLRAAVPLHRAHAAERRFFDDLRDTATPEAMTQLLAAVWRGHALSPESTAILLDLLGQCQTGEDRLRGMLPSGTRLAHKTGTIDGPPGRGRRHPRVMNDVGIIDLHEGSHVAVAVLAKGASRDAGAQAAAIARIARTLYDRFSAEG